MVTRLSPTRSAGARPTIVVRLETMVYGGEALGRVDGRVVLATGGIAGETVRVAITEERKNFLRGVVVEVIEASPDRVTARCRHFGLTADACGGCHWQHIDYAAQLRFKRDIVRDQLSRLGKIADAPVRDTIASLQVWAYRNHAQFTFTADGRPGFQAARSNRVVAIDECHIVAPEIQDWLKANQKSVDSANQRSSESAKQRISVRFPQFEFLIKDVRFHVAPDGFFQVNTSLLETLIDQVLAKLVLGGGEGVIDAYCGVGLFTRFIAPHAGRVVGIESSREAIAKARENLADFAHVEWHAGLVEDVLPTLKGNFEAIVVDPPRAGCEPRVMQTVIEQQIDRVVYVSCDPATLARDARQLIEHGYRVIDVQPIDLFPHTYHIETIALFRRSDHDIL